MLQMKRIFLEGNPYLLALTMAVSMLHSVFDFLAFKNDIGFWRENKSMEGLSARSIVINAVCQLVRGAGTPRIACTRVSGAWLAFCRVELCHMCALGCCAQIALNTCCQGLVAVGC